MSNSIDALEKSMGGRESLGHLIDLMRQIPATGSAQISQKCKCAICGNSMDLSASTIRKSDVTRNPILEPVCSPACKAAAANLCVLACVRCRTVAGYSKPGKDSRLGFEFKAGKVLHLPACPVCLPGLATEVGRKIPTFILEAKVEECRNKGVDPSAYIRSWWNDTRTVLGLPPLSFADWVSEKTETSK